MCLTFNVCAEGQPTRQLGTHLQEYTFLWILRGDQERRSDIYSSAMIGKSQQVKRRTGKHVSTHQNKSLVKHVTLSKGDTWTSASERGRGDARGGGLREGDSAPLPLFCKALKIGAETFCWFNSTLLVLICFRL